MKKSIVPTYKIGDKLIASINIELTDEMVEEMYFQILKEIENKGIKKLIIDISQTEVVDSYFARVLINLSKGAKCLNCESVIVGITSEIALTLAQMGLYFKNIKTAKNVELAMKMLEKNEQHK